MARRRYPYRTECAHPGCGEHSHYEFHSRRELDQHLKWQPRGTWKCVRHDRPSDVLSTANAKTVAEYTNFSEPHGKFWGLERPSNGFMSGPGFRAFAEDFPAGTRVRVTAELILPADRPTSGDTHGN